MVLSNDIYVNQLSEIVKVESPGVSILEFYVVIFAVGRPFMCQLLVRS